MEPFMGATMLTLGVSGVVAGLLIGVFLLVSILMILVVLIQRPQGGGLGGAFGAGGSGETAFGAKTGDALTIATVAVFVIWLGLAVTLVYATRPADFVAPEQEVIQPTTPSGMLPTPQPGAGDGEPAAPVDPATEPVTDPVTEPVTEPAPEPTPEPTPVPVTEPAPDPQATPPADPVEPPVREPAQEPGF